MLDRLVREFSECGRDVLRPESNEGIGAEHAFGGVLDEPLRRIGLDRRAVHDAHRLPPVLVSPFDQHERYGEHGRLFFSLDLDLVLRPQQQMFGAPLLHRQQTDPIAHPSAGLHRRDEAHAFQAVVERLLDTRGPDEDIERGRGQQRQGKKAVRDGTAIGTFAARAFDVDVKPLVVARARRELVDHGLVDGDPMGSAEILAYEIPDRRKCDLCHR